MGVSMRQATGMFSDLAAGAGDAEGQVLLRLELVAQAEDVVGFGAVQFERLGG